MIVLLGASLRFQAVSGTVVDTPIRADARLYYLAALNLKSFGIFSISMPSSTVTPDAIVPPGVSLMLMPFLDPFTDRMLLRFNLYQVILSTLTILAAYALCHLLAGRGVALGVALLTAIAPHLISFTTYLLTETQFTFLLLFGLLGLAWGIRRERSGWAVVGGLLLGLSALTRSTTEYLPLFLAPFLFRSMGLRPFLRIGLPALGTALAVIVAWKLRNLAAIGMLSDPYLATNTILHGMYPDFMFNGMPESYGFPYRYDPFAAQTHTSGEVLRELFRRAGENPLTYVYWYLIGKPMTFLSWNIIGGVGGIFVYPVTTSPYLTSSLFQITENIAACLHFPLTIAALAGCGIVLFRPHMLGLNEDNRRVALLIVAVILYFLVLHMIGAPFPRYSVPLRPIVYSLGLFTLTALGKTLPSRLAALRKRIGKS
ncbi:MAG: glycosyltransferase family 39 protein [Zoogloeaceae bacterium]|nr:glycosyltransferase family 39 protein [Zoogloeaceae bacterium]